MIKINYKGHDYYAYFDHYEDMPYGYFGTKLCKPIETTACYLIQMPENFKLIAAQVVSASVASVAGGVVTRSVHDKPNRKIGNFQAFKKAVLNLAKQPGFTRSAIEHFIQEYHAAHKPRPQLHPLAVKVKKLKAVIEEQNKFIAHFNGATYPIDKD